MNSTLVILIAAASALAAAVIIKGALFRRNSPDGRIIIGAMIAVLLGTSLGVYASIGRFSDWQKQQADETKDHRLAAKITESRRAVQNNPRDVNAKLTLASRYMEGGLFAEAVNSLEDALKITGPRADIYGRLANAAYYRDGRTISPDAQKAIDKAVAIEPNELQSRMLVAQDAFLSGRYEDAIKVWEELLKSGAAASKAKAIQNAIANAQIRLAQQSKNNDASIR